ncbi:DUF4097 family beta strand repeat-containing protein [Thalassomonas actiniarum]|uniref:DUF4097 family beta strand repeat protein n=1 Tax=Thalassomonas actiniarum TaxID=485447 RepID=A0AAF0C2J7_9GAMM|nr:DUF4097 family beta strand repeat-containing protein [Thalassomonas actiniarum]WDD97930.1 DUF4097 family beta strand repeat protein [Thalassomonas actiniarum]
MNNLISKPLFVASFAALMTWQVNADVVDEINKSFTVGDNSSFRLENVNGSVDIQSWQQKVIQVTAIIEADDQDDRDRISIDMSQNDRGVSVETRYEKTSTWGNNHNSGSVDYRIMVPQDVDLAKIELVNGSLTIENVMGEVNAELVNGSIKASGLSADADISSVNGSIKVNYQQVAKELEQIKIETVNGSIKLHLPENISAAVDAETMHGSIKNDFGLKVDKNLFAGRNMRGDIGSGDARISLDSVNGSIKVMKK